jgi:hypothetical protein
VGWGGGCGGNALDPVISGHTLIRIFYIVQRDSGLII